MCCREYAPSSICCKYVCMCLGGAVKRVIQGQTGRYGRKADREAVKKTDSKAVRKQADTEAKLSLL